MRIFESNLRLDLYGLESYHKFDEIDMSSLTPEMVDAYKVLPLWGVAVDVDGLADFPTNSIINAGMRVNRISLIMKEHLDQYGKIDYRAGETVVLSTNGRSYKSKEFNIILPKWLKYRANKIWREGGDYAQ